jgi:hypothetical protein
VRHIPTGYDAQASVDIGGCRHELGETVLSQVTVLLRIDGEQKLVIFGCEMEKFYTLISLGTITMTPKGVVVVDIEMESVLSADARVIEDAQATIVVVRESKGIVDIRLRHEQRLILCIDFRVIEILKFPTWLR